MHSLAVAGLSARLMAQTAASDGFEVVALDLFGDVDTCAAASRWFGIGEPASLQIDGQRLLAALAVLARQREVAGWVAGSGFEGRPDLLAQGAALLPLIGTAPDAVARLRDPAQFFAFLAERDIEHPPVRLAPVDDGSAWLLKDLRGSGGWHIRRVTAGTPAPGEYLQREMPGQPMSATFVANGSAVQLLGVNQQIVRALGASPFAYCGVLGPVPVAAAVLQRLEKILRTLVTGYSLRGVASLDFLLDAGRVLVLEVNPRPPASMALYPQWQPMAAHVRACRHGELPTPPAHSTQFRQMHGDEIVFARQPLQLGAAAAQALADLPDVHDLPAAGQRFAVGQPLCSVSASGDSEPVVLARLHKRRETLLHSLESCS